MNKCILMVGGGRRVGLASRFITAGYDVLAYEYDTKCPLSQVPYCKVIQGKKWDDITIANDLLELIHDHDIRMIIPLMDEAVHIVSLLDVPQAVCSSTHASLTCLDKKKFEEFMLLEFPELYPIGEDSDTYMIKPRFGFGSRGIREVHGNSYCDPYAEILQRYIEGTEYTVDAYFNKQGKMVDAVPRIRTRVAGGEVIESTTVIKPKLNQFTREVGEELGLIGPICAQYIVDNENRVYIIEINARFGGGTVLSMEAGLPIIPLLHYEYDAGKTVNYRVGSWKNGLTMKRVLKDFFFEN